LKPFRIALISALLFAGCTSPKLCGDRVAWAPGSEHIELGKNDALLVCGDPSHAAWENVPPRQSAKFVRAYLESKGYLEPTIDIDYDTNRVTVDAGKRAVISAILAEGAPPGWSNAPLESNLGRALEKTALDQIEGDALGLLKGMGYACGTLKLEAHPDGRIVLKLSPGTVKTFPPPHDLGDYPVSDAILSRFEPFSPGDPYDIRETILAGRRIESEVASSATYTADCAGDDFKRLDRAASFGPRRSWEIGFGASTEEYPLSFVRWKTNRLWSSASKFQAELFGSNKRQSLSFELKYYYAKTHPRLYLRPAFLVEHRNEDQYETYETKFALYQGRAIDTGNWTLEPEIGFSVSRLHILDVMNPRTTLLFTPEITLGGHTHAFELYQGDPRTGYDGNLAYRYLPGSQASSTGVHRLLLQGTFLTNYRGYVEPRWVLGLRYTLGTLFTTDGTVPDSNKIPPDWFFLAGGDHDLRGFGRNTLPSPELGAASVATVGFESRWPNLISFPLEPLVFTDLGFLGEGNAKFHPDLYLSPGIGVRSPTPIGTVRGTLARGLIPARGVHRWQLFLSFGAEF
jgi:outer membrane translocation and assembly module TamA